MFILCIFTQQTHVKIDNYLVYGPGFKLTTFSPHDHESPRLTTRPVLQTRYFCGILNLPQTNSVKKITSQTYLKSSTDSSSYSQFRVFKNFFSAHEVHCKNAKLKRPITSHFWLLFNVIKVLFLEKI